MQWGCLRFPWIKRRRQNHIGPAGKTEAATSGTTIPQPHLASDVVLESSNHRYPPPPLPSQPRRTQALRYRQLLQQRLQKYQGQSMFNIDCNGPQHAQLWKASFYLGSTMIGESNWFDDRDAAKEEAAMHALEWLNEHRYR
ncbi:hypothetical protein M408DRAFT_28311 [Serendipita vermifera MAFF 305830]|uniref:DRBM domain-containing protein n=1 Tax=Serendipita vermifera MAFF 305830 TaxID=933852 RepID=A0A0C3ASE0_SERVB|nr:hypothetical protein M408DRAFT_28311 [Serendipita vermifera MAFF 305830]